MSSYASRERVGLAAAFATSLLLGAILAREGLGLAAFVAAFPLAVALLVTSGHRALLAGVILALTIPTWWTIGTPQAAIFRIASGLAFVPLVLGPWRMRWTVSDGLILVFVADSFLSALFQTAAPGVGRVALNLFLPVAFYFAARALPSRMQRRAVAAAVTAITIGALTVIIERATGQVLFQDAQSYSWVPSNGGVFRPGGVYGSPPAASLVLAVGLLLGYSLRKGAGGWRRGALSFSTLAMTLALVLTFERSGVIALAAGAVVYMLLIGLDARVILRYSIVAGLVAVAAVLAYPRVQATATFQNGVLRPGTLSARTSIWQEELPVVTSSAHTATIGVGFGATVVARTAGTVPSELATHPRLISTSIHDQYLLILLEQGGIGLAIFLFFVGAATWRGVSSSLRTHDGLTVGMTAAVVAVLVASITTTPMLDYSSWILSLLVLGLLVARTGSTTPVTARRTASPRILSAADARA
ncbi:MAG: O-Antigen ligase [Solirubrobacteraceae bacterium]|jgi:O-antigen ligase|nr:O-Antigen ligase [Solirubrobacteraceae bacterium]